MRVRTGVLGAVAYEKRGGGIVTTERLSEAERMQRVPGIAFIDSPSGRVACIAGTGIKVWRVVQTFREAGADLAALHEAYPHLREGQIEAALAYHHVFSDEIDERIAANETFDIETYWRQHPFARPPWH